ncbi:class I SAM-dependent methyltransferase [Actinotalea sp. BY-33]|uniref:Class I SAM-dependent methyltransferase n=1 Tax=Actinotalea soli TaxID=2819234 RepID=A0A939RSL5_9CELL|nr:class I SAM-dependent methyltransferase [Actinotalea soli]MBO1751732.1 class I SAM-dependent methyltransferase [Actinotalea soli]
MTPARPASAPAPDRIRWALELLDPAPSARVLEIGCGPGVAVELLTPRLTTGTMLAIDRSTVAVTRARRRNEEHLLDGRLELRESTLADLEVPAGSFALAFSIDVNLFWTGEARDELTVLHRCLAPDAVLAVLYGPGPGGATSATRHLERVATNLARHGFAIEQRPATARGSGVIARRP